MPHFAYHSSTTVMLNHLARRHPKPSSQQGSIANFTVRSCDSRRAERISGLLAKMIAGDMLPMSVVEGTGLRNLISFLEPTYTVPCRQTMTVRLEKMYREAASLREILSSADKVAITTDAWTALTTESYVTVTVHFFSDWVLQSAILQTRSMTERHTAENMAHVLQAAVDIFSFLLSLGFGCNILILNSSCGPKNVSFCNSARTADELTAGGACSQTLPRSQNTAVAY